jgi:putative transposase
MKRARFSEEQIIGILKAAEAAGNIREVCRENNLTEQTFYRWRRKYGGMDVSEAKKLRELERENTELKKMVSTFTQATQPLGGRPKPRPRLADALKARMAVALDFRDFGHSRFSFRPEAGLWAGPHSSAKVSQESIASSGTPFQRQLWRGTELCTGSAASR